MNANPSLQQLIDRLPQSTQDLLNTARVMAQRGDLQGSHHLLHQAFQHQGDLRFLASIASSLMARGEHAQAFEMLKGHLNEQAPDPNLVILMTEALIGQGNFAYAEQYIDYAARLGGAQPRVENLRALLKQRVRERHSGAQTPKDMALDSRIDLTRPELTSLPLADTAYTLEEHANDPTEFIQGNFYPEDAPHTTALESVPTHISNVSMQELPTMAASMQELPTMAASVPTEFMANNYPPIEDHTLEESFSIPTRAHVPDLTTPVVPTAFSSHPQDVSDATIPFQRSLHMPPSFAEEDNDAPTIHEVFDDDSMDRQVTSYASLQANSSVAYQEHDIFMPLLEEEESKSEVRAAFFGTSQDLSRIDPPSRPSHTPSFSPMLSKHMPALADPAPSFGARPALHPSSRSSLSSASEISSPMGGRPGPRFELHAGDRLPQSAGSSIELDIIAPPAPPAFGASNFNQTASAGDPQAAPLAYEKTKRRINFPFIKVAIALPVVLALLVIAGSVVTDQLFTSTLKQAKTEALQGAHDGTYARSLETFALLTATKDLHHPLGSWAEDVSTLVGEFIPIYNISSARASIAGHRAYHATWIEWRYEAPGSRQAAGLITQARTTLGEDHELIKRAEIFAMLHQAPTRAFEDAQIHYRSSASDIDFAIPMALAAYQTGHTDLSRETLRHIEGLVATQHDQRQLVLMLQNMHHTSDFAQKLETHMDEHKSAELELHILKAQQHQIDLEGLTKSATYLNEAIASPQESWHPCFVARIHHALSHVPLAEQDFGRTLKSLEQAQKICPELPFISKAFATHFIKTGDHPRAKKILDEAIARHPDAMLELTKAALALHQGDVAQHALVLAPLVQAKHPAALTQDARRLLLLGDPDGALAQFMSAHEVDAQGGVPMAYTHWVKSITLPARSGEQDDALTKLIKTQPFISPELQYTLTQLKLERAHHTHTPSERTSLFASAQRAVTDLIATSEYEGLARYELCKLYLAQRRYDSARESCNDAAKIDTKSIQGILVRARLELESGSPSKAKELLLPLDATRHDYLPLAELLVRTYISQGDFGIAEQRLNKLVTAYPKALVGQTLRGRLAFANSRYIEATEALQGVSDHSSHPVEAQVFLAYARIRTGSLQAVEEPLKKHLSHPIWGGYAWLALGELRRRQKRFDDAEENLTKARELLDHPYISSWFKIETLTQRALNWQAKHGWQNPQVGRYLKEAALIDSDTHADLNYLLGALELSGRRADNDAAISRLNQAIIIDARHCASLRALDDLGQQKSGNLSISTQLELHCSK